MILSSPSPYARRIARAENSGVVSVAIPAAYAAREVQFVAEVENVTVEADRALKVVINERTGTIVLGKDVRISPVAILHGALSVEVRTRFDVSQPAPLAQGQTTVVPEIEVKANEAQARNVVLNDGASNVSEESLIAWCREHMAAYKVPRHVEFIDALPRSGTGKIQWRTLQEREWSGR